MCGIMRMVGKIFNEGGFKKKKYIYEELHHIESCRNS